MERPMSKAKMARTGVAAELHRQRGEQDGLAHAGRADHQGVSHVADMGHQPEGRRALGAGDDQRWAVEMSVALWPGPNRRHWHQVGKIQRRDDGLAHVGVGVARYRRQPRVHRVEGFRDGHEAPALDDTLHPAQLLVGHGSVSIEHRHGRGDETEGDLVAAQLLQSASASAALLLASVSTSGLSCWKRVSRNSARMFLRLANHWRRKRPNSRSPRLCPGTGSAYSSDTQSPGG